MTIDASLSDKSAKGNSVPLLHAMRVEREERLKRLFMPPPPVEKPKPKIIPLVNGRQSHLVPRQRDWLIVASNSRMVTAGVSNIRVSDIQKTVAAFYKIQVSELLCPRRSDGLVRPRQVAMFLSKILTQRSMPELGRYFHRDPTTVLHGVRSIEAKRAANPDFADELQRLERQIREACA